MKKKRKAVAALDESPFPAGTAAELSDSTLAAATRLETDSFPPPVKEFLAEVGGFYETCMAEAIDDYDLSDDDREWLFTLVRDAFEGGFSFALQRYAKHLRMVPELSKWHKNRDAAGAKGRATQASTAASRAARAQSMLNSGMEVAAIADELRCSIPTVYRYLNNAAKPRKPRARSRKA